MKCTVVIDKTAPEEIVIHAQERTPLIDEIERLVQDSEWELIGYRDKLAARLTLEEIHCFTVENDKVFAMIDTEKWQLKRRLYQLEATLPKYFVKINQSCIANIRQIVRFDASISGTLAVVFKNGYTDYVSRRQLGHVKERLGL